MEEIQAASEEFARARAEFERAKQRLAAGLLAGYREGLSWAQVAEAARAAGIETPTQARTHAEAAMLPEQLSPSRTRASSVPDARPGVSVTAAAKALGISRQAVYNQIKRGELRSTKDAVGRTRVLIDKKKKQAPRAAKIRDSPGTHDSTGTPPASDGTR